MAQRTSWSAVDLMAHDFGEGPPVWRAPGGELPEASVYIAATDEYVLYVGITRRGQRRVHEHAAEAPWWPEVTNLRVLHCRTRAIALDVEAFLVERFNSPYNGPVYADATRGLQHLIDSDLWPDGCRFE